MKRSREIRSGLAIAGTAAAAACLRTYSRYRRDLETARQRVASGSRIAETRCGPIEYAVAGSGPPVLVVHGAGGGFDQGVELGRFLVATGHTVIAVSRFGYLGTPLPPDGSPQAQADAHAGLLDALNLSEVAVLGASAGAPSSMEFALRYPERCSALVLLVPAAYSPGVSMGQPSAAAQWGIRLMLRSDFSFWAMMKLFPGSMVRTLLATPVSDFESATRAEEERVLRMMRVILPVSVRATGLENDARVCGNLDRLELEKIVTPTLVITTGNDLFRTLPGARYTADHVPNARLVSYPTGGHMLVGHDAELSAIVSEFLESIGAGSSPNVIHSAHALSAGR